MRTFCLPLITLITLIMLSAFTSALSIQSSSASALQVEILPTHSGYINDDGFFYVVGEVKNTGDTPVEMINVTATFYNITGEFVAYGNGLSTLEVILPGRKSPFEIILYSGILSQRVHNYTLSVTQLIPAQAKPLGLEIISNSSFTDAYGFHVTGEIKNVGSEYTSFVRVIATFYNESDYAIATKFSYSNPKNLLPGEIAPFEIVVNGTNAAKVHHYVLEAESFDYLLILEFNPTIFASSILMLTLTSSLIMNSYIRRRRRGNIKENVI